MLEDIARLEADTERDTATNVEAILEPLARVFIHNDDVTPYDFVVLVLQRFFGLNPLE
ncbi:MAG TPA: ATP-dependent Clp protease adaptor ClpS, partial [Promineifilum sp.]|nr:ATP-dependent Clp protease adaptor ClpS [Promineifilum sp.]